MAVRDLGRRPYFRIKIADLSELQDIDIVKLTLPAGTLRIPVSVLRARFRNSKNWNERGFHNQTSFPEWLRGYLV